MMLSAEAERFERRLTEEISGLRADLYREIQAIRLEFHDGLAAVRQEMATLRADMAAMRADTLKWSFLFWIGQVATIAALLSFMLRASAR
jgi:hypothetical protein